MKEFLGKVAVVTGASSGIGRALAKKCASLGMFVVLADINEVDLAKVEEEIRSIQECPGVLPIKTDVSLHTDVQALARKTVDAFGKVHLLFNNSPYAPTPNLLP